MSRSKLESVASWGTHGSLPGSHRSPRLLQFGIVDVATRPTDVKGLGIPLIERRSTGKSFRQVRICKEEFPEGYAIGVVCREGLLCAFERKALVGDVCPPECWFELRANAIRPRTLTHAEERDATLAELARD